MTLGFKWLTNRTQSHHLINQVLTHTLADLMAGGQSAHDP